MDGRVRVREDGTILLPQHVMESLDWGSGSTLRFEIEGASVKLIRVEGDPAVEPAKPKEIKPEDRSEYWL